MRASIEISDEQTAKLRELAARRGEDDFSGLVREAIDLYLARTADQAIRTQEALSVLGSLDESAAEQLERSVRQIRSTWR